MKTTKAQLIGILIGVLLWQGAEGIVQGLFWSGEVGKDVFGLDFHAWRHIENLGVFIIIMSATASIWKIAFTFASFLAVIYPVYEVLLDFVEKGSLMAFKQENMHEIMGFTGNFGWLYQLGVTALGLLLMLVTYQAMIKGRR